MNYGEYHHSLNRFDRENFEKIIRDSRRFPEVSQEREMGKIKYEYRDKEYAVKSKIRAVQSRNEFQNLSVIDEILLRFYGRFGLTLNKIMRFTNNKLTLWISNIAKKDFQNYTKKLFKYLDLETYKDVLIANKSNTFRCLKVQEGIFSISIINYLDQLITNHRSEHINTDYFYRIAFAKKNRYVTQEEASKIPLNRGNIIKLGNVVMDRTLTSVGNDLQSVLFRYSHKGQSATLKYFDKDSENQEEILYVIKNNEKLNYMDIAGFKLNKPEINVNGRFELDPNNELLKGQDEFSSGELIIPSHTPFRVVGIQKMDRTMNRRVVLLEPMKLEDINQTDIVQNNFNGEPFSSNGKFNLEEFTA
jgi:hypothetical protein